MARPGASSQSLDLERAREVVRGLDRLHDRARGGVRDRRSRDASSSSTASRSSTRACQEDELLAESAAGELIDTEIEIRSGRGETFAEAVELQRERRARALRARRASSASALAATGTHPWANYLDQRIIDTPHYRRLRDDLRWVAQRNNTWSLHVHVGVRGADRAIAVCDHLRELLPPLLALSANSPFLDGRDTGLHSVRTEIFTRTFPRCGVHEPFGDWDDLRGLRRPARARPTRSSSRPSSGGACARTTASAPSRCGSATPRPAATSRSRSPALITACVAQAALDYDDGRLGRRRCASARSRRTSGGRSATAWTASMIDFDAGEEIATRAALERLLEWTGAGARARSGSRSTARRERRPARRARARGRARSIERDLPRRGRRDPAHLRAARASRADAEP